MDALTSAALGTRAPTAESRLESLRRQAARLLVHIESLTRAIDRAADEDVREHLDHLIRVKSQRLADVQGEAVELEREWAEADIWHEPYRDRPDHAGPSRVRGPFEPRGPRRRASRRTADLISHGRPAASRRRVSLRLAAAAGALGAVVSIIVVVVALSAGGPTWPPGVRTVRNEASVACRNPNVRSEPGQVNFACARATRRILWVFALMTSHNDPAFVDAKTGRRGLEPISPAQGGELAWSLNLHHPYDPADPIDSLEVAARAINNIIGGATLTGADGKPSVQPGLEGSPAGCARYTGSAAVTTQAGFPAMCTKPIASQAGRAALVADVYRKWMTGGRPAAARDAAVLFTNADNPGDPHVQAILRRLLGSSPRG